MIGAHVCSSNENVNADASPARVTEKEDSVTIRDNRTGEEITGTQVFLCVFFSFADLRTDINA